MNLRALPSFRAQVIRTSPDRKIVCDVWEQAQRGHDRVAQAPPSVPPSRGDDSIADPRPTNDP